MNESDLRRLSESDAERILSELSTSQHLTPHRPLGQILSAVQENLDFCPMAAQAAIKWLQLDAGKAIGRLRRSELIQLARCIHRYWSQSLSDSSRPQPAC